MNDNETDYGEPNLFFLTLIGLLWVLVVLGSGVMVATAWKFAAAIDHSLIFW